MDKINDMIGKACYEAWWGLEGVWDSAPKELKEPWIRAGCAARNVLIPNVATESQPVDDFLVGRPSPS